MQTESDRRPLFATSNPLKFREAHALMAGLEQLDIELPELQALDVRDVVEAKLRYIGGMNLRRPVIVEDTGLVVEARGGLPGALVKWFLTAVGADGTSSMLRVELDRLPARAVCAVGATVGSESAIWEGETIGFLVPPRGPATGWNSIFEESESGLTFAEMSDDERLAVSMRRRPLLEAATWLSLAAS